MGAAQLSLAAGRNRQIGIKDWGGISDGTLQLGDQPFEARRALFWVAAEADEGGNHDAGKSFGVDVGTIGAGCDTF